MAHHAALSVGFGRRDITPDYSVPMQGYGNNHLRMSQGVLTPLLATCIAVSDGEGHTLLLLTVDVCDIRTELIEEIRTVISAATGVDGDHIMVSATHTHAGPDILPEQKDTMAPWRKVYMDGLAGAAADAMADRRPAKLRVGQAVADRLNFSRHYLLENGTYAGPNFGDFASAPIADYATRADNRIQILQAARQGAPDILLVNWQAHAQLTSTSATRRGRGGRFLLSADYIAPFREYLEGQTGAHAAFFLGASGDVATISNIREHTRTTDYQVYGQLLAQTVLSAIPDLRDVSGTAVRTKRKQLAVPIDHSEDHLLPHAQKVAELWAKTNDYRLCIAEGFPCGVASPYHALAVIRKAQDSRTHQEMDLTAACVGDVGFVAAPYEMFSANGCAIKEGSPFEATFVLTCANGCFKYIAAEQAFAYGSYEVHNRIFPQGTGEALAEHYIGMLKQLR